MSNETLVGLVKIALAENEEYEEKNRVRHDELARELSDAREKDEKAWLEIKSKHPEKSIYCEITYEPSYGSFFYGTTMGFGDWVVLNCTTGSRGIHYVDCYRSLSSLPDLGYAQKQLVKFVRNNMVRSVSHFFIDDHLLLFLQYHEREIATGETSVDVLWRALELLNSKKTLLDFDDILHLWRDIKKRNASEREDKRLGHRREISVSEFINGLLGT